MSSDRSRIKYNQAINEAFHEAMSAGANVMLIGQGVKSPWYVGHTADGLLEKFGDTRVIDTPISENAMTGMALGAALAGMKPVVVHPRMDFMLFAFDPIVNEAANWHYMNGGKLSAPVVFWGIINRKGEQAAQHSQALHAMLAHAPGLKVVMPATPYDAKGLLIAALNDPNPVVYIDDRFLHNNEGNVPEGSYEVEIGAARVVEEGGDITIVSISSMLASVLQASAELQEEGISTEVIDLRTIKPLDTQTIFTSVKKTGRLLVADVGWLSFGVSAEVSALVADECFAYLKAPIKRIALPDCPAPASRVLEEAYYPTHLDIVEAVKKMVG